MKRLTTLGLIGAMLTLNAPVFAQTHPSCKKKEDNLQLQLRYAEKYGNIHRAEDLKRAILNVREHCGKESYQEDPNFVLNNAIYKENLTKKIDKQRAKVNSAADELKKAEHSGKAKKIREKTEKLKERQMRLDHYLSELESLSGS
ncbi:DUF1090 domain-containing protein [Wohlfahrtiimonas chitiniclastica]|uniref:Protein yqjC n=1 Tax=Wohlfahrtiimonas chitiniclastica SH04 TaxID=1261130 RepID=L8Y044_9GAMM|nr:DUF1090 family protein [Wohlfahrtiimonas chitiniclastica]ELV07901.1 Protein yqjC [Wohlfahrtiimonas chitiniclastica SH04]KZX36686.1 hypothetical protein A6V30_09865 [Wohlfahrtiimonas chitiniclastica]MBS7814568.1 DUF1090 domain-containing protein [Wohlfahrtiimonas chitiniclastica]MBS7818270.1 DUF1090 domain-containing protein [Wohlfahrtiimonas chitiniclastica]MBS7820459.1 DUF1090 domain-containing protein [Wohlfahrtiimonas chitiniclastica]